MSCGCNNLGSDGKKVADLVRGKGFENKTPTGDLNIPCECGTNFKMETLVCNCPNCNMTYAVTPCSSSKLESVHKAGMNY